VFKLSLNFQNFLLKREFYLNLKKDSIFACNFFKKKNFFFWESDISKSL